MTGGWCFLPQVPGVPQRQYRQVAGGGARVLPDAEPHLPGAHPTPVTDPPPPARGLAGAGYRAGA